MFSNIDKSTLYRAKCNKLIKSYYRRGWKGISDFLGYKTTDQVKPLSLNNDPDLSEHPLLKVGKSRLRNENTHFVSFAEARDYARSLGLTSANQWRDFAKTNELPSHIPPYPDQHYYRKGWRGFPDFLGYSRVK